MSHFDFSCEIITVFANISDKINNRNGVQVYTYEANLKISKYVVANVEFLKNTVPEEAIIASAKYPETIICVDE